jgi:DnaJ-class molecular chaperone
MANSKRKVICSVCNGNGFVRVPFEQSREEQWADCDFCNNQGEIEEEVDEDADGQRNPN